MEQRDFDDQQELAPSLFGLVQFWEAEREAIEAGAEHLGALRKANRERAREILARLADVGGSIEIPGWIIAIQPDGRGLSRTRVPARRLAPSKGNP